MGSGRTDRTEVLRQTRAADIVQIALSLWLFFPAVVGFTNGFPFMVFLHLVAFLGNLVAGMLLLIKHRKRTPALPVTSLTFAGFAAASD